ncbi:MAG: hypothetical protein ACK4UN_05890, partial [Limisphaerales bacterium]
MLEVIEKLLILQDRDRKIIRNKEELSNVAPERKMLQDKASHTQAGLEAAKLKAKQLESERKRLELEVEALNAKIAKYSVQQFETKKNEEFRALGNEIEKALATIDSLKTKRAAMESLNLIDARAPELGFVEPGANQIESVG